MILRTDNDSIRKFKNALRDALSSRRIPLYQLAKVSQVHRKTFGEWLSSKRKPRPSSMRRCSENLQLNWERKSKSTSRHPPRGPLEEAIKRSREKLTTRGACYAVEDVGIRVAARLRDAGIPLKVETHYTDDAPCVIMVIDNCAFISGAMHFSVHAHAGSINYELGTVDFVTAQSIRHLFGALSAKAVDAAIDFILKAARKHKGDRNPLQDLDSKLEEAIHN